MLKKFFNPKILTFTVLIIILLLLLPKLSGLLMLLFASFVLAAALNPFVNKLQNYIKNRAVAASIIEPKRLGFGAGDDEKQDHERMKNSVMEEVRRIFKPEFLNRIDETIVFRALNKDDMKHIVTLLVKELQKRCKEQLDIELTVRDSAKAFIVDKAYDRKYGARPLKRKLQEEIEDRMSEDIITGKIKRGDKVIISTKNKQISLTVE